MLKKIFIYSLLVFGISFFMANIAFSLVMSNGDMYDIREVIKINRMKDSESKIFRINSKSPDYSSDSTIIINVSENNTGIELKPGNIILKIQRGNSQYITRPMVIKGKSRDYLTPRFIVLLQNTNVSEDNKKTKKRLPAGKYLVSAFCADSEIKSNEIVVNIK